MSKQAVVLTGGKQYFVKEGETLVIDRIPGKEKERSTLTQVLLIDDGKDILLGKPYLEKAKVELEIVKQDRGEKLRVARFKAKSKYRRVRGFRQELSQVKVIKIS
jgi:large subunit ribosomal protein L21